MIVGHSALESHNRKFLYYREDDAIDKVIWTVLNGKNGAKICWGQNGYHSYNINAIIAETHKVQEDYNKVSGYRIRREYVIVEKDELHKDRGYDEMILFAHRYSLYYNKQAIQVVWAVYDRGNIYYMDIAINPVSPYTGLKYRNNKEIAWDQDAYANALLCEITGRSEHKILDDWIEYMPPLPI